MMLLFVSVYTDTFSQFSITGVIMTDDPSRELPVGQIGICIPEINRSVVTNDGGVFGMPDLPPDSNGGAVNLSITFLIMLKLAGTYISFTSQRTNHLF